MNESKPWYKSWTIWAGIVGILIATYSEVDVNVFADALPNIPEWAYGVLAAIGIGGRTVANKEVKWTP